MATAQRATAARAGQAGLAHLGRSRGDRSTWHATTRRRDHDLSADRPLGRGVPAYAPRAGALAPDEPVSKPTGQSSADQDARARVACPQSDAARAHLRAVRRLRAGTRLATLHLAGA